jgi:hypothetical protein
MLRIRGVKKLKGLKLVWWLGVQSDVVGLSARKSADFKGNFGKLECQKHYWFFGPREGSFQFPVGSSPQLRVLHVGTVVLRCEQGEQCMAWS